MIIADLFLILVEF